MRPAFPALAAILLLSACHASVNIGDDDKDTGDNVHLALGDAGQAKDGKDHISLDVPGFSAKLSLPDMNLGGHMDLDGIKLAPNTDVKSMDIQGHDKGGKDDDGHGTVRMAFTNSGTPASVIDYYKKAAAEAGYQGVAATGTGVSASKEGKQFAMSVAPDGAGSRGTITMNGDDQ